MVVGPAQCYQQQLHPTLLNHVGVAQPGHWEVLWWAVGGHQFLVFPTQHIILTPFTITSMRNREISSWITQLETRK